MSTIHASMSIGRSWPDSGQASSGLVQSDLCLLRRIKSVVNFDAEIASARSIPFQLASQFEDDRDFIGQRGRSSQ
ncbi:hypothetical protein BZM26_09760 [Paraburkholderia strydomiana]|nr:hypothetical protein BZM26_09760 [Paraburkholderia strydomiana]